MLVNIVFRASAFVVALGLLFSAVPSLDLSRAVETHHSHDHDIIVEYSSHDEEALSYAHDQNHNENHDHSHEHRHSSEGPLHSHEHSHGSQFAGYEVKLSLAPQSFARFSRVSFENFVDFEGWLQCQGYLKGIFRPPIA